MSEFKLPELGENIESADVVAVLIKVGDKVDKDQNVIEIETDKATVEVPSEVSGVVTKLNVKEGDNIPVGSVIFEVDESGKAEVSAPKEEPVVEEKFKKPLEAKTEEKPQPASSGSSEFRLPELGENIETADITEVLIKIGDKVEIDQTVVEIETDKATVEVPSDIAGTVTEVYVKSGDTAKVGQVLFTVEGAAPASKVETKEEPRPEFKGLQELKVAEVKKTEDKPESVSVSVKREMPSKIAPASPSVRRFAREIGVDIHMVRGNGPGGRISIKDVKAYAKNINEEIAKGGVPTSAGLGIKKELLPDFSKWGTVEVKPMTNVRKKTAEHLSYAWATIPHVTQMDKADITELDKLRKKFSPRVEKTGGKLTVTAMLVKVVASALKVFPQFNSSIDMEKKEVIYKNYYNIGIAVDTERGLLVPTIKDADKMNVTKISVALTELSKRARDKKTTIEEMQGGTFSISNLGGIGGTYFTPIVNSPEVAILGVSRSAWEPKYIDGSFEPRFMMPLSLSYDHRIIDGADAIRFLRWIIDALENPFLLSLEG